MFGDRFSSSTTCSRWRYETEPGQLDQSLSCRFWKVATHPSVVLWNARPRQRLPSICRPHLSAIVDAAKLRGGRERGTRPEPSEGRLVVIGHRQASVLGRRSQRLDVHADQQRKHGKRQEGLFIAMRRQCTRSREQLRRRRPPPGIPRPVRLGRDTEHGGERGLRLAQRDPARTQRAGLHDVTPCHRCRAAVKREGGAGVLQSANLRV